MIDVVIEITKNIVWLVINLLDISQQQIQAKNEDLLAAKRFYSKILS